MTQGNSKEPDRGRRKTGRTAALLLADQGVVSAGNFLVGLALGRSLLPAEYGAYTLAFSTLNALNTIQGALITTPMTVFGASLDGAALRNYYGGALAMQGMLSTVMSLVALAIAGLLWWTRPELAPAFLGLALLIGLDQAQEFIRFSLLARLKVGATFLNDLAYAGLRIAALGGLIIAHRCGVLDTPTARGALLCAAIGAFVATGLGLVQMRSLISSPVAGLHKTLRENWKFGRWNLAGAAIFASVSQFSQWLLAAMQGPAAMGALGACQTLVFASNPLMNAFSSYWGPVAARDFARGGVPALRVATRRFSLGTFLVMATFAAFVALAARPLLHVVYSGRYDGNAGLLALIALSSLLVGINRPLSNAFLAMRLPKLQFTTAAIGLTLSAVLSWPAIRYFGLLGFPLLNIAANFTMLVIRGALFARAESLLNRQAEATP